VSKTYSDYSWIIPGRLAQGGYPGAHPGLFQAFDVVVYMAEEAQPKIKCPPGKLALYGPMDDDIYRPVPREIGRQLHMLAQQCAQHASYNKRVLITCMQGKNRSGLVMGLTLLKLYPGWTPEQAITIIRRNRKLAGGDIALSNTMFEQYLRAYGRAA
jgi:protein-tyrosine phosphatase